jgi:hypothetical protein
METILLKIQENIELVIAILTSIGVLIGVLISEYKKIRQMLADKELMKSAMPLITQAEKNPLDLLHSLVQKDNIDVKELSQNELKNSVVVQALQEREPKLLKQAKLKDAFQIADWVSKTYQIVKPIIKGLKK